ncbi:Myosin IJ heavy chain, putative [Eimeria praecox]|uniref:Myosin IJ heavy chain, putative n=1 Tax=Eimeria praecox TaxID=51316 RepID=U6G5B8_9EIME|nr:Myosin IJ heavy chain, putative [Eimeria praecox]
MAPVCRARGQDQEYSLQGVAPGALAWAPSTEEGFVTVKILKYDNTAGKAQVVVDAEGASSVAAAQAAADVLRDALAASTCTTEAEAIIGGKGSNNQGSQRQSGPSSVNATSRKKTKPRKEKLTTPWSLNPPEAATEAFADPLSHRPTNGLKSPSSSDNTDMDDESEGSSDDPEDSSTCTISPKTGLGERSATSAKQLEDRAAAAAAAAADAAIAGFISQPPFEVPISNLWPYSAPPLPPHPMPDDSACCGTLSAAALLQLLQHRYLRNEIYTYAANVLLAVNPYKPLPHLYSAQQISLYRHWREIARVYRRQLNEDKAASTGGQQSGQADSATAIRSILDSLPGVLPVSRPPSSDASDFHTRTDSPELNPWMKGTKPYSGDIPAVSESRNLGTAIEQAFKETTASRNRPPPHPFVVAEEALRRLVGTQTSQTIVVSGQSGAGKTETSKQLMLFLTHVSTSPNNTLGGTSDGAAGSHGDSGAPKTVSGQRTELAALLGGVQTLQEATELQKRIVSCNAIFESFGNAATRRNHNSSRIGRLTLLHFDSGGLLRGGSLRTYLLEASRITAHKRGDRNFHVFYQLLTGASEEMRKSMGLTDDETAYRMLQPQDSTKFLQTVFCKEQQKARGEESTGDGKIVLKEVDRRNFESMVEALKRADFSTVEIDELLQLLAGLLHLSNVSFTKGKDDNLQLQDAAAENALNHAASLLGVDRKGLEEVLQCRRIVLKGDVLCTRRNEQQSSSVCCSLIKFIYSRLFDHIVQRLNDSAARHMQGQQPAKQQQDRDSLKSIGILDIYGFESFGLENGLEQLCINYANERQQQLFVQQVIEEEVALYTREGVTSPAVAARNKLAHQRQNAEQEAADLQPSGGRIKPSGSFKADLELSLLSSLPDTPSLLRDLQEGKGMHHVQRGSQEPAGAREQHILFCLKGANGMQAAEAAANGTLLQHLQQDYLTSIGLVGAQQLQTRKTGGGLIGGQSAAGKVQERVFAVKHFAGTVLYGTDGWLDLNNDRVEHELENLVAKSTKSLLRHAMQQHEESQKQEGVCVAPAGGGQFSSITKRFLKSVKDLNQELQGPHMQLHFIRCFIPNGQMKPDKFERKTVLHQLQHSGSLALVDILQSGFPHRMPLRSLATRLRKALSPLVAERLKEQEDKVQKLLAHAEQQDTVSRERRILETLRHCNPVTARDRTLVSATLGLLPQSRPGSFICGVSLVCFKASVYGEAAAMMADPGQFFKTPKDMCRLITAIQRLRWRLAVRIILHVHPALLWLQRRAFLMRKIKEAAVTAAVRIILLRKHILRPLRESVQRRISIRHGIKALERILLRQGLQTWRRWRQLLAAAEAAKSVLSQQRKKGETTPAQTRSSAAPEIPSAKAEVPRPTEGEEYQSHNGIPIWNARLYSQQEKGQEGPTKEYRVALFPGRDLYSIHYSDALLPDPDPQATRQDNEQQVLQIQKISFSSSSMQKEATQHKDSSVGQIPCAEGKTASTSHETNSPLVTIAKHPSYANLYVACTSAAQMLLLSTASTAASEPEERQEAEESVKGSAKGGSKDYGEPSTSLPCLAFPSAAPTSLASPQSVDTNGINGSMGSAEVCGMKGKPPSSPSSVPRSRSKELNFPTKFLPSTPIPPGKWLPRDLLHEVTRSLQHQTEAGQARPLTVRPLSISFANPVTADYVIIVCLVQGGSKSSSNSSTTNTMGKLIAVLVDLVRRAPAGWIPLFFASHDISICARRNAAFLQQLSEFLHHPPADCENQPCARDPPLRLLWNMSSVPRVEGMTLELADVWLTGCTYTRLAPPHLSSLTGTDPIIQALQMMPFGEAARSLEAKMQRLLLLSTADNLLLLLQWSERGGDPITSSGNLVLLDQISLPFPVLQFLREGPEEGCCSADLQRLGIENRDRLLRAFPWEGESLLPPLPANAASQNRPGRASGYAESDDSTSGSACSSSDIDQSGVKSQTSSDAGYPSDPIQSLKRDFNTYRVAMVDKNTGRVVRELEPNNLQPMPNNADSKGQVLAVTCLNSGVLASVHLRPPGIFSLCLGDEKGNWNTVGDFDLLN